MRIKEKNGVGDWIFRCGFKKISVIFSIFRYTSDKAGKHTFLKISPRSLCLNLKDSWCDVTTVTISTILTQTSNFFAADVKTDCVLLLQSSVQHQSHLNMPKVDARKSYRKYCFFPNCENNFKTTPGKHFFLVPDDIETKRRWADAAGRGYCGLTSTLFCCQDHFKVW